VIVLTLFLFASLEKMGALDWNKIVHQNQGWRLISCIWLHAGLIHLVVNMLSLLFIGIRLEQQFGFGKLLKSFSSYANIDPTIHFS
jgi:membrane associated rhomboid family serine protease